VDRQGWEELAYTLIFLVVVNAVVWLWLAPTYIRWVVGS
jgi:hypothetical protein